MQKTKQVEINGRNFQIGKLSPKVGSYILMRMMGASVKAAQQQQTSGAPAPNPDDPKPTGEDMVRALSMGAFFNGLDFDMFTFVQDKCLEVVSLMVGEAPLSFFTSDGTHRIAHLEFEDDPGLLVRLSLEVLVFNLSDFFDQNAFEKMTGPAGGSLKPSHSPKT